MQNFGMSMLWFWISYIIVTLIGVGHAQMNMPPNTIPLDAIILKFVIPFY